MHEENIVEALLLCGTKRSRKAVLTMSRRTRRSRASSHAIAGSSAERGRRRAYPRRRAPRLAARALLPVRFRSRLRGSMRSRAASSTSPSGSNASSDTCTTNPWRTLYAMSPRCESEARNDLRRPTEAWRPAQNLLRRLESDDCRGFPHASRQRLSTLRSPPRRERRPGSDRRIRDLRLARASPRPYRRRFRRSADAGGARTALADAARRRLFGRPFSQPKAGLLTAIAGWLRTFPYAYIPIPARCGPRGRGPARAVEDTRPRDREARYAPARRQPVTARIPEVRARARPRQGGVIAEVRSRAWTASASGPTTPRAQHQGGAAYPAAGLVFLFVGRLTRDKGVLDLARAFAGCRREGRSVSRLRRARRAIARALEILAVAGAHAARVRLRVTRRSPNGTWRLQTCSVCRAIGKASARWRSRPQRSGFPRSGPASTASSTRSKTGRPVSWWSRATRLPSPRRCCGSPATDIASAVRKRRARVAALAISRRRRCGCMLDFYRNRSRPRLPKAGKGFEPRARGLAALT